MATMALHKIRLRGGWEWQPAGAPPAAGRRVTLPLPETDFPDAPFTLVRHFGAPVPADPDDAVALELARIPGLVAIRLNGRPLALPNRPEEPWSIPLAGLLERRNTLVLEVDPARGVERNTAPASWGEILLAIGPRGDGGERLDPTHQDRRGGRAEDHL